MLTPVRSVALMVFVVAAAGCGSRQAVPSAGSAYADDRVCAGCHADIAAKYKRTGMGRSFAPVGAGNVPAGGTYFHPASTQHFAITARDGRFFQSRFQKGKRGETTNFVEKEIHFVMGSGNHARTFLHRTSEGKLIELPVAWYAEGGGHLAMNPGYDRRDHPGFRRTISDDCMFCHNAYPALPPDSRAHGGDALFPATPIAGFVAQPRKRSPACRKKRPPGGGPFVCLSIDYQAGFKPN